VRFDQREINRFLVGFVQVNGLAFGLVEFKPLRVIPIFGVWFVGFLDGIPTEDLVIARRNAAHGEFAVLRAKRKVVSRNTSGRMLSSARTSPRAIEIQGRHRLGQDSLKLRNSEFYLGQFPSIVPGKFRLSENIRF
jgi:hypothetical protein